MSRNVPAPTEIATVSKERAIGRSLVCDLKRDAVEPPHPQADKACRFDERFDFMAFFDFLESPIGHMALTTTTPLNTYRF